MSERKHRVRAAAIQEILKRLMKKFNEQRKQDQAYLSTAWQEIAGERISKHTFPENIVKDKLYIHVENAMWMNELTYLKEKIKIRANEYFLKQGLVITAVIFKIGNIDKGQTSKNPS
jgi:predicted nucleic acid-binding Zn ribbon protein